MTNKPRRVLLISDFQLKIKALYLDQIQKLGKGLIRLGYDVRWISYGGLLQQLSPFKSRSMSAWFCKHKVDQQIATFIRHYQPDWVILGFAKFLDRQSVDLWRKISNSTSFIAFDVDLWPQRHANRFETASALDIVLATNNGDCLNFYRDAGVKRCYFLPNCCDPDVEYRYPVGSEWYSEILWTGKVQHKGGGDPVRNEIINRLLQYRGARVYGCLGRPEVQGIDYLYAISGAKIGISINAVNTIPLYHSDRFTQYAACGAMVLAKRVPQTELLMEDKKHVVYFDTAEECMELADWYLIHDTERQKIANAGMERCHHYFNMCTIAQAMVDIIEKGYTCQSWMQ